MIEFGKRLEAQGWRRLLTITVPLYLAFAIVNAMVPGEWIYFLAGFPSVMAITALDAWYFGGRKLRKTELVKK